jgi:hypothetical protein
VQLSDLLNHVSRLWTPPPRIPGRKVMVIPFIRDINNSLQAGTVAAQCAACAKQLAPHLFVWRRSLPQQPTLKSWDTASLSFQGMDLDLFREYLMRNFVLKTFDSKEWLLDRAVAAAIWAACVEPGSPLPEASWEVEITLKREAARK